MTMHFFKELLAQPHVFRVGDQVVCIDAHRRISDELWDTKLQAGLIYTIVWTGVHPVQGPAVNIDTDTGLLLYQYAWHANRFRLAEPEDNVLAKLNAKVPEQVR